MTSAERYNKLIRAADAETRRRQAKDAAEGGESYARCKQREREIAAENLLEQSRLMRRSINRRPTLTNA